MTRADSTGSECALCGCEGAGEHEQVEALRAKLADAEKELRLSESMAATHLETARRWQTEALDKYRPRAEAAESKLAEVETERAAWQAAAFKGTGQLAIPAFLDALKASSIERDEARARAEAAEAERDAALALLREVWDSVPSSFSEADPMVQRHARALNSVRAFLAGKP